MTLGARCISRPLVIGTPPLVVAAFVAAACSSSGANTAQDPQLPDGQNQTDAAPRPEEPNDAPPAGEDAGRPSSLRDGGGDAAIEQACARRCDKARCPDREACVQLCVDESSKVPPACEHHMTALEACIDATGTWGCSRGEAEGDGDCLKEANAAMQCMLAVAFDASAEGAQTDAAR